jgi:hypothetical protein
MEEIYVGVNQLTVLPDSIHRLEKLVRLDAERNKLVLSKLLVSQENHKDRSAQTRKRLHSLILCLMSSSAKLQLPLCVGVFTEKARVVQVSHHPCSRSKSAHSVARVAA